MAAQVGPAVEVVVAARDLPAGSRVARSALAVRRVPARYLPPDALGSAAGLAGARLAAPIPAGSFLTPALLEGARDQPAAGAGINRGRRAVTVEVVGGAALEGLAPPAAVDVLVSTEPGATGGRTAVALAGVDLLRVSASPGDYGDPDAPPDGTSAPTALATLRVSLRQAVYLTAADNFAREIRLLARPPGDRSRAIAVVAAGEL